VTDESPSPPSLRWRFRAWGGVSSLAGHPRASEEDQLVSVRSCGRGSGSASPASAWRRWSSWRRGCSS